MHIFYFLFLVICFPIYSFASSISFDRIIIEGAELPFGSAMKGDYYYPLKESDYYQGFLHGQRGHFSTGIGPFRVMTTGCSSHHSGFWGIENDKLFLLDLKPCSGEFEIKNFSKKVFASWVDGVFIVEHPEKTLEILCLEKNTYLMKDQKFYYLSIRGGNVNKFRIIKNDVVFLDHAFARFSIDRYWNDPKSRSVILACQ